MSDDKAKGISINDMEELEMRIETTETMIYKYDELSESAQEKVREWYNRAQWNDGIAAESMTMIFDEAMKEKGWHNGELRTYDLYQQGGYPTFRAEVPEFTYEGHRYTSTIRTRHMGGGNEYMYVDTEDVNEEEGAYCGSAEYDAYVARIDAVSEYVKTQVDEVSGDLFHKFREEDEYMGSDSYVREACEANGYEFTEDGELA